MKTEKTVPGKMYEVKCPEECEIVDASGVHIGFVAQYKTHTFVAVSSETTLSSDLAVIGEKPNFGF